MTVRSSDARPAGGNAILRALSETETRILRPLLAPVDLRRGDLLIDPERPVRCLYFPHAGLVSVTVALRDGPAIEAAAIGPEGVTGLDALLPGGLGLARGVVQIPGTAARLDAALLARRLPDLPDLRARLLGYGSALVRQILQAPACIAGHDASARLARWLLVAQDCIGRDRFDLTHETAAEMLGVRRPTVSLVAHRLQAAGLVRYRRGRIEVLDRAGLEAAACECYATLRGGPGQGLPSRRGGSRGGAWN